MFQQFDVSTQPENGPIRLKALRAKMVEEGVHGFLVPRSDAHQGEDVAPRDERLAWLTGFAGSAGLCAATIDAAAIFVDSRYTLQVAAQVDLDHFQRKDIPKDKPQDWLGETLKKGDILAFDPWLQTKGGIEGLEKHLSPLGIALKPSTNLVDAIWDDQPAPPTAPIRPHDLMYAGKDHATKRAEIAANLKEDGIDAAILTLPPSIAWLLNIRGEDVPRTPAPLAFAVLHVSGKVDLFVDPQKLDEAVRTHLGPDVTCHEPDAFMPYLEALYGTIQIDKQTAPIAIANTLTQAEITWKRDPCILPKAQKNDVELDGARAAHARDAVAMCEFLAWLDRETPHGGVTEINAAQKLEGFRRATNALQDISFETISGAGPNGAIVHYRVNTDTNRTLDKGSLYLVDSGGQYLDGTTDITRTIAIGTPPDRARTAFTAVLKGMIELSRTVFPEGSAGRDIDGFARAALWQAGLDFDHGTGHGVGSYLGVHEGPAGISRRSHEPILPGMILSNEPGYYKEGDFGIRIENLIVVNPASTPEGGDRQMLSFETLTFVPIDTTLIVPEQLGSDDRDWLNTYHAECAERLDGLLSPEAAAWLAKATQPV